MHLKNIYKKMQVHTRTHATVKFLKQYWFGSTHTYPIM
jgi:DNA-binding CsgD family transcriptional regulator